MKTIGNEIWALIPARGGSKSIPLKNLVPLGGRFLIDYVFAAAKASKRITRIICSTEDEQIARHCKVNDVEVHQRPAELAKDETPVKEVLIHLLENVGSNEGKIADFLPILQPTSPFLLPSHIDQCIELMENNPNCDSSQTVTTIEHNKHAFNQRRIIDGYVGFCFPEERRRCYNKQLKPSHYIFGNLIVTRARSLLKKGNIFGRYSIPLVISEWYALDVDGPNDLEIAEWALQSGKVNLPHIRVKG